MYLKHSRSQQMVYKDSLLFYLDSSSLNLPCSTFIFLLSLAWLLTQYELKNWCEMVGVAEMAAVWRWQRMIE
jgi:hypothetical protein